MHLNNKTIGHLAAMGTVSVWGATFISTKVLLGRFTAAEILMLRVVLAFAALCVANPKAMPLKTRWHELYFAASGLTGLVLYFLFENIALGYGDASMVGIIVSSAPLFAGIFGAIFLGERISQGFVLGFAVAITGICLIGLGDGGVQIDLQGTLLSLAAAMTWGIYSTLMRKIAVHGYPTMGATKRVFAYGLLLMLPVAAVSGFRVQAVLAADSIAIANLLFLGLGASAVCFLTWNFAVKVLGSVKTCVYIYASPVVTVTLAAIILKERMGARAILGAAMVLAGLALSEGRLMPQKEAEHGAI